MSLKNASLIGRATLAALTTAGLLAVCGQSTAHHAFAAEFDADQPIDLKGAVTKIKWVNPHSAHRPHEDRRRDRDGGSHQMLSLEEWRAIRLLGDGHLRGRT
jgi:hypothetical protein